MIMNDEETEKMFQKFVLKRLVKVHEKLGWESNPQDGLCLSVINQHFNNLVLFQIILQTC